MGISNLACVVLLGAMSAGIAVEPAMAGPVDDACALLTPEQVGQVVDAKMSAGVTPTPTFKRTCTWTTKGIIVTLNLQGVEGFNAAKGARTVTAVTPESGVGDEAFYVMVGDMVSLFVKKGNAAFKATVYSSAMAVDKKKAIEKTLAQQVLSKI